MQNDETQKESPIISSIDIYFKRILVHYVLFK